MTEYNSETGENYQDIEIPAARIPRQERQPVQGAEHRDEPL